MSSSSSSRPSPPSPSRLERLREELAWLRERCSVSAAVRGRSARRKVTLPGKPSLEGCLRELSEAQRGWEALLASAAALRRRAAGGVSKAPWRPGWEALAAAAEGTAALPENSQETLLNFLDLGLALIRCIQASRAGRGPGGGGGGRRGRPRASQGPPAPAPAPWGPEGEEASSLDALLEKVEAWQKEVDALKGTKGEAKHVYGKKKKRAMANLGPPLAPILDLEEGFNATPQKAEGLQWKLGVLANLEPPVTSILDPEEEEATFTAPHNGANPQKVEDLQKKLGVLSNLDRPVPTIEDPEEKDALLEKADAQRKEAGAPWGGATQKKVKDLQQKQEVLDTPVITILDTEEEEEEATLYDLWDGATPEKVMDLQGNWRDLATPDMLSPIEDPEDEEEEETTLDALLEKTDALQKEAGALKDGVTLQGKVKDLQGKRGVLALALRDFIAKEIWALEQEAEALWDAWFLKALRHIPPENLGWLQEKVGALNNALREFVADTPLQKKMSALEKMEALRDALQEDGSALRHAPLERDALWEKVTELNFALWEIQLDRMVTLLGVVDACWDALRKAPQNGVGALLKKLKAMQGILRATPLKELSVLHKITSGLLDAMVDFPRDAPAKEKQYALWDALQDVPLKEMGGLWGKVRTLWGIPLKLFGVWEKVYNLKVFLWDDSQNRVCNLQENVEALKDALRDALWEKMGAEQDKLSALWASVQSFPLSKLVALQDKLNALEERLLSVLEEKHSPLKETASASQKVLGSLHSPPRGELSEIPEEEVDAQQRTPAEEEIMEADKTDSLPAWKTPDPGESQRNPGKAHLLQPLLQPWTALQMNNPIPVNNVTSFSMEQVPNPAFPNTVALPGLQNGQLSCTLETQPSLLQPVLPLSATAGVLSNQHETPSGMTPPQPAVPSQPPTLTSSFAIPSTSVADSAPDVDQIQSTPTVGHTTDSNAVLNHSTASDAREGSILKAILRANYINPEPWQSSRGTLSTTQQGDFSKTEQMINLSVDHNISVTASQPDDHGCSQGQNTQETEELISEDVLEAPLSSSEQTAPELANSEPLHKKQKTDPLHNSQGPTLDQEMMKEYRKYRKCVLAILNQYKSRVDKLRTKLKQSPNQTCALKDTEEIKALTSTLKREQAVLKQFDCFRDVHKSKDDP
ncbi:uncharacterized protein LOC121923248 isoform X2 [Sceloporus undulatus]|uniref:uncharacterized protein LOC121923248 isoform X2 n=1 Tax=Sceloporus undulatus TaxID=8520 RepID=UPI001C4D58DC|nr:uncharacterized protein LOC121923248 isoform X2 [Sceloporus undulatus]